MAVEDDVDSDLLEALEASFDDDEPVGDELPIEAEAEEYGDDAAPDPEATEAGDEAEPPEVFQPPEHWSSDLKAQFSALPAEAQQVLIDRDAEFQRGYQEKVQGIAEIRDALEPWQQAIAQRGLSPANAIRTLLAAQASLERDPLNGILRLAQNFGIQDQLKGHFVPDTDDYTDPVVKDLKSQVAQLQGQLAQFGQTFEQNRTSTVQQQIDSFANAKDAQGALQHPHFEQVRHLMVPLVSQGKSMEDAYAQAVWTVPEFREKAAPSAQEQARKVAQAKKAARGVRQRNSVPVEADEELTIEQALRKDWKKLAS